VVDAEAEVAARADFSIIRYAQCWEDADTLLAAVNIRQGDTCFSVGSGGENSLSLLSQAPRKVVAVDLSPAQNACLELKAAGFRGLSYETLLELVGVRPSTRRIKLYDGVRQYLSDPARAFWDANRGVIESGLIAAGKFENYFALFRRWLLPLIHSRRTIDALFEPRSLSARLHFYNTRWNNWRWRALSKLFVSRCVLGRLGRDPRFFDYVEGEVAKPIFARTKRAFTELDPSRNPYLQWIAWGQYRNALPHVWREENFDAIRTHIDRLEIELVSVESYLGRAANASIDRFNLSDIFEYISPAGSEKLFHEIVRCGRRGGRLAYWNMQASRRCPADLAERIRRLDDLSRSLYRETTTFFYSAFYVDELR
jgi:S-adenosylmethionine-diacylglycerol 3-amino-3-carboxypropyl transferase